MNFKIKVCNIRQRLKLLLGAKEEEATTCIFQQVLSSKPGGALCVSLAVSAACVMEWKNAHSFLFGHLRGRPPRPFKKTIYLQFFCRKGSLTQWWPRSKVMHIISAEPHSPSALSQCGRRPPSDVSLTLVYLKQQRLLTPPPKPPDQRRHRRSQMLVSQRSHQPRSSCSS